MMNAVKYLEIKSRCCERYRCEDCPLGTHRAFCGGYEKDYPEEIIKTAEQWAIEHPKRTYLSLLLEKFPNASLTGRDDAPPFCPHELFGGKQYCECGKFEPSCFDCWNREYKENN